MKVNDSVFKSYDIRGVYPLDLDKDFAFSLGKALVNYTAAKNIAVGYDARLSSPELFNYLTKGIVEAGANVLNLSMVPTECVYFAVSFLKDCDAGIMITASHNPKEYNGFKMLQKERDRVLVIRGQSIKEDMIKTDVAFSAAEKKGIIKNIDIWEKYFSHIFSSVKPDKIKPFKIVIDGGNGVAGIVIEKLRDMLPIEIIGLNLSPDGNFFNRSPNPLAPGASAEAKRALIKEKADFGFLFDGDADRIFLMDERGDLVRADITLLFLAKYFLDKIPSSSIIYNIICSKAVPEFIKKWGGNPIKSKVGFVNIRETMMKNKSVLGGELSGHYSFKDNFYFDSGFLAFLILLEMFSKEKRKISELVKELSLYVKGEEINFKADDKEGIIKKVEQNYPDGKKDFLDGLTVRYNDWWFNLRPSNTEPLLRLTIEADNKSLFEQKKKELIDFLSFLGAEL